MSGRLEKIPPFLWIPAIAGAGALLIGGLLAIFYGLGYVEGFGSLLVLTIGWCGFRAADNSKDASLGGFGVAPGIRFFARPGMGFDRTGNFYFNQPMQWLFCPENSDLQRETVSGAARGGGVSLSQNFECADSLGDVTRKITMFEHLAYRFIQYVLLGSILLYASCVYGEIKKLRKNRPAPI